MSGQREGEERSVYASNQKKIYKKMQVEDETIITAWFRYIL